MSQVALTLLERSLSPLSAHMNREDAEEILRLRADGEAQGRMDELADKCNDGTLTPDERAEYEMFVWIGQYIAGLQARARRLVA